MRQVMMELAVMVAVMMAVAVTLMLPIPARAEVPTPPETIPATWLAGEHHPRAVTTSERVAELRASLDQSEWRQAYLQRQQRVVEPVMELSDEALRDLVPPPESLFIYGLGMNLDPVHQERMRWAGWEHPHHVRDAKNRLYPNDEWPDTGQGVEHPETGKMYYFVAIANGEIATQLEFRILPALADIWALTGSDEHAHTAAVLLDAIAAVYPTNRRGPMDYPTSAADMDRGGRLNRPYYQVARGLMNYVHAADLIAASGALDAPSAYAEGASIREHVARNLLWDGAAYCYDFAQRGHALHNGQVDYARGAALVGALLDVPMLAEPLLEGHASFEIMLDNNIDQDGFYYETSPTYAAHTRGLYVTVADMIQAMHRLGWEDVQPVYEDPTLRRFLTAPFNRREIGGHVPLIGDAGPDRSVIDPLRRSPVAPRVYMDNLLDTQIESAWVRLVRGVDAQAAAQLLRNSYGDQPVTAPRTRWALYNVTDEHLAMIEAREPTSDRLETDSVFYGGKGLALLRGGEGSHRHGTQLFFGPIHNHGQDESLTWTFFARGAEWSFDQGYYNTHFRVGWTTQMLSHQAMVVNEQSVAPTHGAGQLLAWHDDSQVQWAMAAHDAAYADAGVNQYERLIAQAQTGPDGELAYWLDVGRVVGGEVRDDSFHLAMQEVELDVTLPEPDAPAVYGDVDYGRQIRADMTLEDHQDKGFYWGPPGEGYGFLGSPRRVPMEQTVRAVFRDPAFVKEAAPVMVVDLAGAEQRELIVAEGPTVGNEGVHPAVPYLLRRDRTSGVGAGGGGEGASTFAKLIRLADDEASDPIAAFTPLKVTGQTEGVVGAWCVTWKDGRQDVWIVGEPETSGAMTVQAEGLPTVQTDGRVTLVRFDAEGNVLRIDASEASRVNVEGEQTVTGPVRLVGDIAAVDPSVSPATFEVDWHSSPEAVADPLNGMLLRTIGEDGSHATWTVDSVEAERVRTRAAGPRVGSTRLEPMPDQPGWYRLASSVSRFISRGSRANTGYAVGRPVYVGKTPVGRVAELADDAKSVRLVLNDPSLAGQPLDAAILLAGPGDRAVIPLSLRWRAGQ